MSLRILYLAATSVAHGKNMSATRKSERCCFKRRSSRVPSNPVALKSFCCSSGVEAMLRRSTPRGKPTSSQGISIVRTSISVPEAMFFSSDLDRNGV